MVICIIGVDGVGKTTHAQRLLSSLENDGVCCKYSWFRFYHFGSIFLLAYCRLVGLTIYEMHGDERIGRHEFYRSKLISFLYPWILFIDMIPMYIAKIFLPMRFGYTVVCDRFIYDTFVDLMIDLKDDEIQERFVGKLFLRLIPKNTKVILLDLNESIIRNRRRDLVNDHSLEIRREMYLMMANKFKVPIVNNAKEIKEVEKEIYNIARLGNPNVIT